MNFKILLILLFLSTTSLIAKERNWQLVLDNGDTISDVYMQILLDSLLICSNANSDIINEIAINSIIEMKTKSKESKEAEGAGLGLLIGGAIGAGLGYMTYDPVPGQINLGPRANALVGGIVGGLFGMVTGSLIGSNVSGVDVYDLSQFSYEEKVKFIQAQLK